MGHETDAAFEETMALIEAERRAREAKLAAHRNAIADGVRAELAALAEGHHADEHREILERRLFAALVELRVKTDPGMEPIVREADYDEGTEVACPVCGSSEFQRSWYVASTAPTDLLRDGDAFEAITDHDSSTMHWGAVRHEQIECASCCTRINATIAGRSRSSSDS